MINGKYYIRIFSQGNIHIDCKFKKKVKCIKDLYKSTYKKHAFRKNKKYQITSMEELGEKESYIWIEDEEKFNFIFSKKIDQPFYFIKDYFK